jgi:hypothetical protein
MDHRVPPWDKKYTRNMAAFAVRFRLYQWKEKRCQDVLLRIRTRWEATMKRMVIVVLMLLFGVAAGYAQQNPVKMKSSGSERTVPFNVNGSTFGGEETLTGGGSLGQFTYLGLRADSNNVTTTDACPDGDIPVVGGAGIFRFSDGSLMSANITGGDICIDANGIGHLTDTYQVTGGTGRFQKVTGELLDTPVPAPYLGHLDVIETDGSAATRSQPNALIVISTGFSSLHARSVGNDRARKEQKMRGL